MTWLVMSSHGVTRCHTPQDVVFAKADHLVHIGLELVSIVPLHPHPSTRLVWNEREQAWKFPMGADDV